MDDKKSKQKAWIRPRHQTVRNILNALLTPYTKWKYGMTVERFRDPERRAYLILYNHQTPFDQFFVGMSFPHTVYYLATEDIFSLGPVSSLIRYLVAPIPIKKQTLDLRAIRNCMQVVKEGGTVAIAPEGNRTYSGRTEYMSPSIAPLARRFGLPIALYRIEGGYGAQPRWSDVVRKGKMRAYVSQIIEPEEYADLSDEALFELIKQGLYVDEAKADGEFHHRRRAEYIERLLYVCPFCGLSRFESQGDKFRCQKCGREFIYRPDKRIEGVGFEAPHAFVGPWYDYQKDYVCSLDLTAWQDTPMYTDRIRLSRVIVGKKKQLLCRDTTLCLYGDRLTLEGKGLAPLTLDFGDISVLAVLGRNKLNIYHGGDIYQIKGEKRFNAIQYVHIFYHHKNVEQGDDHGKFLGL